MKMLASIRLGHDSDLVARAAGVCLKEWRKLMLVAREMPLSTIHFENMFGGDEGGRSNFSGRRGLIGRERRVRNRAMMLPNPGLK
jgi:hypothetical protein